MITVKTDVGERNGQQGCPSGKGSTSRMFRKWIQDVQEVDPRRDRKWVFHGQELDPRMDRKGVPEGQEVGLTCTGSWSMMKRE